MSNAMKKRNDALVECVVDWHHFCLKPQDKPFWLGRAGGMFKPGELADLRRLHTIRDDIGPALDLCQAVSNRPYRVLRQRILEILASDAHEDLGTQGLPWLADVETLKTNLDTRFDQRLSLCASVLVALKSPDEGGQALGKVLSAGDPPILSDIRFRAFVRIDDDVELLRHGRRIVMMVRKAKGGAPISIKSLAQTFLFWGPLQKRILAGDYFHTQLVS